MISIFISDNRCFLENGGSAESFFVSEDVAVGSIIGKCLNLFFTNIIKNCPVLSISSLYHNLIEQPWGIVARIFFFKGGGEN